MSTELTVAALHVHRELRARFIWTPDEVVFRRREHWAELDWRTPGPLRGDCDDYALTAAAMLLAQSVPAARLRLVYCLTELDEGHLVCTVAAGDGRELVLDNRQRAVWPVPKLIAYTWVSMRQLDWAPLDWREVRR